MEMHAQDEKHISPLFPGRPLDTPVLLIIFNRPDTTRRVFEAVSGVAPSRLFVQADGPRQGRPSDGDLCRKVREIVKQIDWACDVKYNFSDVNLGCRTNVINGINWFFSNVESGIILEDDCLPNKSFFWFCKVLLEKFRDDERIMQISGSNFISDRKKIMASYYVSRINDIWGWATWRRAWRYYDEKMKDLPEYLKQRRLADYFSDKQQREWFLSYLMESYNRNSGVWSTQWSYSICKRNAWSINPSVNLVRNIGFTGSATHGTSRAWELYGRYGTEEIEELVHPETLVPDDEADRIRFEVIRRTDPRLILSERIKSWMRWTIIEPVLCVLGRIEYILSRLAGRRHNVVK